MEVAVLKVGEGDSHNETRSRRHNLRHRFEIVKSLGQGTYGKVKLAIDKKTGLKVAIKSIAKKAIGNDQDLIRVRREIQIMASLNHKHIVQIHEVFENKDKIVIVMEYVDGGELYDYISAHGKLNDNEARRIYRQIVSAVHYLHENGVVHRDLKLENVLLDGRGNAKLADFGLSNSWQHNRFLHTFCGSPLYASPEIVNGRPYYGPEVDCWSLGVLLYTLVYGAMPFDGSDFARLRRQISNGDYYEPVKPSDSASLIRRLLTVNPAKRASITDICCHWWTNVTHCSLWDEVKDQVVREKRTSDYFEDDSVFIDHPNASAAASRLGGDGVVLVEATSAGDLSSRMQGPAAVGSSHTAPPSILDSSRRPKKGILKTQRAKCSSGDSGCALAERGIDEGPFVMADIDAALDACDGVGVDARVRSNSATAARGPSAVQTETVDWHRERPRALSVRPLTRICIDDGGCPLRRTEQRGGSVSSNSSGDLLDFSYDSGNEKAAEMAGSAAVTSVVDSCSEGWWRLGHAHPTPSCDLVDDARSRANISAEPENEVIEPIQFFSP